MKDNEDLDLDITKRLKKVEASLDFSIFPKKDNPLPPTDNNNNEKIDVVEDVNKEEQEIINESSENIIKEDEPIEKEEIINESSENIIEEEEPVEKEEEKEIKEQDEEKNIAEPVKNNEEQKSRSIKDKILKYLLLSVIAIIVLILSIAGFKSVKNIKSSYIENSTVNYQVCLKDNNYYAEKCLKENGEYLSSITDTILIDYNYKADYQTSEKKDMNYYIKSSLIIKNGEESEKVLLKQEKQLISKQKVSIKRKSLSILKSIEIPFSEYNLYAFKYKNDFSLTSQSTLEVSLILEDEETEKELSTLVIPLTQDTYHLTKKEIKNQKTIYERKGNIFLIMLFTLFIIIGYGVSWFYITKLCILLWNLGIKPCIYKKELNDILNNYDSIIVSLKNKNEIMDNQELYEVESFQELLDAREIINKPILYNKVDETSSEFYLQDQNKTYKYTIKESNFDEYL